MKKEKENEIYKNQAYAYRKYMKIKEERGLTDYEVWKLCNGAISKTALSSWGQGHYNLKLEKLAVIAKGLGVPVIEFIEGANDEKGDETK